MCLEVVILKGSYVLLIQASENHEIKVGKLGELKFEKGWYAYVGSGLNNLEKRIERHLRNEKKTHWHIDYLLKKTSVENVIYAESMSRNECEIANNLSEKFSFLEKFGSSDCNCESHLFYNENISKLEKETLSSFEKVGLEPEKW